MCHKCVIILGECDTRLGITKNTDVTPLCYADGDYRDSAGCSVNVELDAGDYVNVKVIEVDGCIDGDTSGITGFLGNLMKPL